MSNIDESDINICHNDEEMEFSASNLPLFAAIDPKTGAYVAAFKKILLDGLEKSLYVVEFKFEGSIIKITNRLKKTPNFVTPIKFTGEENKIENKKNSKALAAQYNAFIKKLDPENGHTKNLIDFFGEYAEISKEYPLFKNESNSSDRSISEQERKTGKETHTQDNFSLPPADMYDSIDPELASFLLAQDMAVFENCD